jgi:hypothetical protein
MTAAALHLNLHQERLPATKMSNPAWSRKTVLLGRDREQLLSPPFGKVLAETIGGGTSRSS